MKKRIVLCLFMFGLLMSGCSFDNGESNQEELTPEGIEFSHGQVAKNGIKEYEDGWVYKLSITFPKIDVDSSAVQHNYDEDQPMIGFMGYNLKYKKMEDCYIPIEDSEGNVLDTSCTPIMPNFANCQSYRDETNRIIAFLDEKKLMRDITLEDLKDLDIKIIDKKRIVEVYNLAIHHEPDSYGRFALLPNMNMVQSQMDDGTILQGAYIEDYGHLGALRFEIILPDGRNLSNLMENEITEKQQKLQENLNQLKDEIMKTQVLSSENINWKHEDVMDTEIEKAVGDVLKMLYTGSTM